MCCLMSVIIQDSVLMTSLEIVHKLLQCGALMYPMKVIIIFFFPSVKSVAETNLP